MEFNRIGVREAIANEGILSGILRDLKSSSPL